jgi:hypothetical protein
VTWPKLSEKTLIYVSIFLLKSIYITKAAKRLSRQTLRGIEPSDYMYE